MIIVSVICFVNLFPVTSTNSHQFAALPPVIRKGRSLVTRRNPPTLLLLTLSPSSRVTTTMLTSLLQCCALL